MYALLLLLHTTSLARAESDQSDTFVKASGFEVAGKGFTEAGTGDSYLKAMAGGPLWQGQHDNQVGFVQAAVIGKLAMSRDGDVFTGELTSLGGSGLFLNLSAWAGETYREPEKSENNIGFDLTVGVSVKSFEWQGVADAEASEELRVAPVVEAQAQWYRKPSPRHAVVAAGLYGAYAWKWEGGEEVAVTQEGAETLDIRVVDAPTAKAIVATRIHGYVRPKEGSPFALGVAVLPAFAGAVDSGTIGDAVELREEVWLYGHLGQSTVNGRVGIAPFIDTSLADGETTTEFGASVQLRFGKDAFSY